jgi:alpha-1,2-mannosyltransferase
MVFVRIAITAILLAGLAVVTALSITTLPFYDFHTQGDTLVLFTCALWVLFAAAYYFLRRVPLRAAVVLIVVGSVGVGGAALAGPPNMSTDSARYAWDGIVQNAGISPYTYAPTSSHLRDLRPDWLFPAPLVDRATGTASCTGSRILTSHEPGTKVVVCTAINRATAPTIYPPSSELLFAGIRFLVGPNAEYWPMQLVGLLMSLGVLAILLVVLRRRGLDPRWAALWGWCPLVANEAVTNSHVDTLGALLLLASAVLVSSGRRWSGGLALGASIAAKLIPAIGAPALLRRQPWKILLASVGIFLLLYVPYIFTSGIKVLGYLPKYLTEEGYNDGKRFALLTPLFRETTTVVVVVLLVVIAILVWRKSDPASPWMGEVVMIGSTLLILSPRYPWYALLLVPMIAMTGRWEWLAIPLALAARTLEPYIAVTRIGEFVALVIVIFATIARSGPGWGDRLIRELRHPLSAPAWQKPE